MPDLIRTYADDPALRPLIAAHVAAMRGACPDTGCHVLNASGLGAPGVQVYALRDGDAVLGMGALRPLAPGWAELKSMHVRIDQRGRGLGRALLDRLIAQARAQGVTRLSLETGHAPVFAVAVALYRAAGFSVCDAFGPYAPDPASLFMEMRLI